MSASITYCDITYSLYVKEFGCLWRLLTCLEEFAGCDGVRGEGGGENVRGDRCVAGLVGEMNEERKALVRKVNQISDNEHSEMRTPQ